MAASPLVEASLLCPQCTEIYCVPVLLQCGHNICKVCLQKFWAWKGRRECPVCGTMSVPERPPVNLALKLAVDQFQGQKNRLTQELCVLHKKKLNFFCQNDEEPICFVCQKSMQHQIHDCCSVEEAAQEKKTEISTKLDSWRKMLKTLTKTKEQWEGTRNYIQTQADLIEKAIKEEFEKLHLFLLEEENTRIKVLKQEEGVKIQVMCDKLKGIEEQIQTLSSTIRDIDTTMKAKDLPFLLDYKQTKKRVKCNIGQPECIRDILIDSAKHLGSLKYGAWKKMANIVQYVPVSLDPNTAQANLRFSEELTCVQYNSMQKLPDNPERCTNSVCVLGATGFTSGKHSWTIDVGEGKNWYIGVANESINRKHAAFLSPSEGFWVIGLCNGDSYWAKTTESTKLVLKQKPQRITVELDYAKGKVVFLNAATFTQIHIFKDKFRERIFPYFSPGMNEDGNRSHPLTICPMTITVDVLDPKGKK